MPADIKNFQSNNTMTFNKNGFMNKTFNLIELIEMSKKRALQYPEDPNFPKGYLPTMQYSDKNSISDIFMDTINKTFDIDGAQCVRFILLDHKGRIYPDLEKWTQVLPNSFLARISCSYRNFNSSSLTLDYFIDMNEIQLNNETSYGSTTISVIDKTITAGYVSRGTQKIEIDPKIADFNNNKEIIFLDFFKYDFGNAIKGLNLKN